MTLDSARPDALIHPPSATDRVLDAAILVVEDNAVSQRLIIESLRRHGFRKVVGVSSGEEALHHVEQLAPNLIILDLMMPNMDGFALCREFRKRKALRNIPILVHTALEDEQARLSIFGMGASDLVRKPVNDEELVARCRIHIEKSFILKDLQDYRLRMEDDLGHARAMQNMLMPDNARIAEVEYDFGLDIRSLFSPSFVIGGDFWGMRPLPGNRKLALYIGDFTGHGVTAAINVFRLSTLMDKLPPAILSSPEVCLQHLNQQLFSLLPIELFATMFYAVLDTAQNRLTYCIAGSPPPIVLRKDGGFEILKGSGLPLAAISSPRYRNTLVNFNAGDALLLYSDALIETPDNAGNYLDIRQVGEALSLIPQAKRHAERLLQHTISQLSHFTPHGVEDDLTLNVYMRNR